jgi:hypothetical protein
MASPPAAAPQPAADGLFAGLLLHVLRPTQEGGARYREVLIALDAAKAVRIKRDAADRPSNAALVVRLVTDPFSEQYRHMQTARGMRMDARKRCACARSQDAQRKPFCFAGGFCSRMGSGVYRRGPPAAARALPHERGGAGAARHCGGVAEPQARAQPVRLLRCLREGPRRRLNLRPRAAAPRSYTDEDDAALLRYAASRPELKPGAPKLWRDAAAAGVLPRTFDSMLSRYKLARRA